MGNPSLIITLPADPKGGGVAWHDGISIFPTSWSAESADLRVEVAEKYGNETPEALATELGKKLSATATVEQKGGVSGFPGALFSIGQKRGLAVAAEGRQWLVLLTPKTSAGTSAMAGTLASVVLERWGNQRWVRRSLGGTKMNANLPFELAPEMPRPGKDRITGYELHFDDFRIEASIGEPGEDSNIDFNKTIENYIQGEKSQPGTTDFKSQRQRYKGEKLEGDIVTLEMKRGTRSYRVKTFFAMDDRRLLRMDLSGNATNPVHDEYAQKIIDSLKVASVNFANFAPRQLGSEGVWFDAHAAFDGPRDVNGSKMYGVGGAYAVDVRVTPWNSTQKHNPTQLMEFLEAKLRPSGDAKDVRSDTVRTIVDGVEARVLRIRYKEKGRRDDTLRYGMAIFLPSKIVVAEMIANEEQADYLERFVSTAKVELPMPDGWTRRAFGTAGLSLVYKEAFKQEKKEASDLSSYVKAKIEDTGFVGEISEEVYKGDAPMPGIYIGKSFQALKSALGAEGRIKDQRPVTIGTRTGVLALFEWDTPNGLAETDLLVLKQGKNLWVLTLMGYPSIPGVNEKRAVILNSLR